MLKQAALLFILAVLIFGGFNYYYDEKGTHPFRYILIQGIAYFERKESGWVFKEFNVRRAEQTNSDKILE